jgi:transcriptional regulator GlxA family with amidase domain
MARALARLDQPLSVDDLAASAHMSSRTYLRRFRRPPAPAPSAG